MRYDDSLSWVHVSQTNTVRIQYRRKGKTMCVPVCLVGSWLVRYYYSWFLGLILQTSHIFRHLRFSFTFSLFAVARVSSSIIDPHPRVRTLGLSALSGRHTCEFMIFKLVERADGANMSVETPHQPLHRADPPRRSTANKDPKQQHKSGRHRSDDERAATLIGIRVGERSVPLVVITQSGRTGMGLWSRRRVGWGVYGWRRR